MPPASDLDGSPPPLFQASEAGSATGGSQQLQAALATLPPPAVYCQLSCEDEAGLLGACPMQDVFIGNGALLLQVQYSGSNNKRSLTAARAYLKVQW